MTMIPSRAGEAELRLMLTFSALVVEKTESCSTKDVCGSIAFLTPTLRKDQEQAEWSFEQYTVQHPSAQHCQ